MKVLITDDEHYCVKAIQDRINWKDLSKEKVDVYSAYNCKQAQKVISQENIDILICDIEMPRENGLDLISWIRQNKYDTEVIIITCHAQFGYAKEAVTLGVYDYCVKPLDYQQMEGILKNLMEKIIKCRKDREQSLYGSYWVENKSGFEKNFWESIINGAFCNKEELLYQEASKLGVSLSDSDIVNLVLICAKSFQIQLDKWNQEKINQSILSVAKDIMEQNMGTEKVFLLGSSIVVISINQDMKRIVEKCNCVIDNCKELLNTKVCCYIGNGIGYGEIYDEYERLSGISYEDVTHSYGVFHEGQTKEIFEQDTIVIPQSILDKLDLGQLQEFEIQSHIWVTSLVQNKMTERNMITLLKENYLQAFYHYLMRYDCPAENLSKNDIVQKAYYEAGESVDNLEKWIHYVMEWIKTEEHKMGKETNASATIIHVMKEYIDNHISEDITREQIADAVHLNSDYASRLFKRYEQESLMEYVGKQRIAKAIYLMKTTNLSIGDIAYKTGFVNLSHFSTQFRNITGCSPREYRKKL